MAKKIRKNSALYPKELHCSLKRMQHVLDWENTLHDDDITLTERLEDSLQLLFKIMTN